MNIPTLDDLLPLKRGSWLAPVLGIKTKRQRENAENYRRNRARILARKAKARKK